MCGGITFGGNALGQNASIVIKKYDVSLEENILSNYASIQQIVVKSQANDSLMESFINRYKFSVNEYWLPSRQDSIYQILVNIKFDDVEMMQNGKLDEGRKGILLNTQNQYFRLVKSRKDGSIKGLYFLPDTSPIYVGFVRTIWSHLQLVQPSSALKTWEVDENQITGGQKFGYSWNQDTLLKKPIFSERSINKGLSDSIAYQKHYFIANTQHNRIQEIYMERKLFQFWDGKKIANISQKLTANNASTDIISDEKTIETISNQNAVIENKGLTVALNATLSKAERKILINQKTLKGRTWNQLKSDLGKAENNSIADCFDLVSRVRALLVLFPSNIDSVGKLLNELDYNSQAFWILNHGLIEADTESSWKMIEQVLHKYAEQDKALKKIIPKLALAPNPPKFICKRLLSLKLNSGNQNVKSFAGLTLSSILGTTYKNTDFADSIMIDLILTFQKSATSVTDTIQLLNELGNYGSDKFFHIIESNLNTGSIEVKASAVYALRFLKNREPILIKSYQNNTDDLIKKNILEALDTQPNTTLTTQFIATELCKEQSQFLAKIMVSILRKTSEKDSDIRNLIKVSDCRWSSEVQKVFDNEFKNL
jgi:hypothetical protein